MENLFSKNFRHLPTRKNNVLPLPTNRILQVDTDGAPAPFVQRSLLKKDDEWEVIDTDSKIIYPREDNEKIQIPFHKIHRFGIHTKDLDDQNVWGTDGESLEDDALEQENEEHFEQELISMLAHKPKYKWVIEGKIGGGKHPEVFEKDLSYLDRAGFKAIVAIGKPVASASKSGFNYMFIPEKGFATSLKHMCEFIYKMEIANKPVFITCHLGVEYTGAALAAYCMYRKWFVDMDESIEHIRECFDDEGIISDEQEEMLGKFGIEYAQ